MRKILKFLLVITLLFIPFFSVNAANEEKIMTYLDREELINQYTLSDSIKSRVPEFATKEVLKDIYGKGRLFFLDTGDDFDIYEDIHTRVKLYGNEYVYCLDGFDVAIPNGLPLFEVSRSEIKKVGLEYILANGYPNKLIVGSYSNKGDEITLNYFTTQLAIWIYLDLLGNNVTVNSYNNAPGLNINVDIWETAYNLAQKAKTVESPSIDLGGANFSLIDDYYISSKIKIKGNNFSSNKSVSITLNNAPKGTVIVDDNNNIKDLFSINDTFYIKIPKNSINKISKFNINVSMDKNRAIAMGNKEAPSAQDVTFLINSDPITDSITFNILKINKLDIANSSILSGAHLILKDSSNNIIDEWDSADSGHYIVKELNIGEIYTLTETLAPEGFILSEESVKFKIMDDGSITDENGKVITDIIMYNEKENITIEEVPITSASIPYLVSFVGCLSLMLGIGVIIRYGKF